MKIVLQQILLQRTRLAYKKIKPTQSLNFLCNDNRVQKFLILMETLMEFFLSEAWH